MFYGKKININEIFPLTREIFDQLIHSSELGGLDWEVSALLDRLASGDKTEKEVDDRIAENKRKRPYICTSDFVEAASPHPSPKGRVPMRQQSSPLGGELERGCSSFSFRRLNKYAMWSGYSSLDIDHIDDPIAYYADHIKGHEVEWGIDCAFRSPSQHGIKIIFRIAKDVQIADAQRSLAQLIGCDYDSSTKDAARATFLVSKENFFYITEGFLREKTPQAPHVGGCGSPLGAKIPTGQIDNGNARKLPTGQADNGKAKKPQSHTSSQNDEPKPPIWGVGGSVRWKCKRPTKRVMMILDVAMRSRSITRASFMIKGQRHTQLKNLLSTQVGLLLTKEEFMGGFLKLCPKFRKEDNLWKLVSDFYENYISEDKPLSATFANTFRQVLNIDDDGNPLDASLSEECGVRSYMTWRMAAARVITPHS